MYPYLTYGGAGPATGGLQGHCGRVGDPDPNCWGQHPYGKRVNGGEELLRNIERANRASYCGESNPNAAVRRMFFACFRSIERAGRANPIAMNQIQYP